MCKSLRKKQKKDVKMHKFLVCSYNSQDFAKTQENFAWSHDRETVTFRNSASSRSFGLGFFSLGPKKVFIQFLPILDFLKLYLENRSNRNHQELDKALNQGYYPYIRSSDIGKPNQNYFKLVFLSFHFLFDRLSVSYKYSAQIE